MLVVIYKISASTQKKVCIYLLPVPAVAAILSISGDLYISKYSDLFEYGDAGRKVPESLSAGRRFYILVNGQDKSKKGEEYSKDESYSEKLFSDRSIDECQ